MPYISPPDTEPARSMQRVWFDAFNALLTRLPPEEAIAEANKALLLCNEQWEDPEWIWTRTYKHKQPVGMRFKDDGTLPPNNRPRSISMGESDEGDPA